MNILNNIHENMYDKRMNTWTNMKWARTFSLVPCAYIQWMYGFKYMAGQRLKIHGLGQKLNKHGWANEGGRTMWRRAAEGRPSICGLCLYFQLLPSHVYSAFGPNHVFLAFAQPCIFSFCPAWCAQSACRRRFFSGKTDIPRFVDYVNSGNCQNCQNFNIYGFGDLSKKTRAEKSWILVVLRAPDLSPRPHRWPKRWMVQNSFLGVYAPLPGVRIFRNLTRAWLV